MEIKNNLTMQEVEKNVAAMRQIFDVVRMISIEGLFSDVTASGRRINAVKIVLPEKLQCREE